MAPVVFLCSLCGQNLDANSKTLPCFHEFCYHCLVNYFSQRQRECLGNDSFKCPNCSEDLLPTDLKKCHLSKECKLQKVMLSLKAKSFLSVWQKTAELKKQKEKCDQCSMDSTMTPIRNYCKKCEQFLCEKCFENHKKFTLHSNNEIIDLTMDPKKIKEHIMPTLQCRTHKNAIFRNFCQQCHLFMCKKCLINHNSSTDCSPAIDILHLAKIMTSEMGSVLKELQESQNTLKKRNKDLKRMVETLQSALNATEFSLTKNITLLKDRASELIKELTIFKNKQVTKLEEEIGENDHLLQNAYDLTEILHNMLYNSERTDLLLTFTDIKYKWLTIKQYIMVAETKEETNQQLLTEYQQQPNLYTGTINKMYKLFQSVDYLQMNKTHQLNDNAISCTSDTNLASVTLPMQMNVATVHTTLDTNDTNDNSLTSSKKKKKRKSKKRKKKSKEKKGNNVTSSPNNKSVRNATHKTKNSKQPDQNKDDNSVTTNKDDLFPNKSQIIILKKSHQWSMTGDSKKTCITLTKGGDLLMCDTDNNTLLKYHYNGRLLSKLKIPGPATAICTASDKLYFVTLPLQKLLIIITISNCDHSIIIIETIRKREYFYLNRVKCGILACDLYGNVNVLNTKGNVTKNVIQSKSRTKEKSYSISAVETEDIFWVLDNFDQKLLCFDIEGTLLNSFQLKETQIISIFVDKTACLYGCDEETIYRINFDGTVKKLVSNKNKSIRTFSLYFSLRTRKLFQCCYDNKSGFIQIFKISRQWLDRIFQNQASV